MQEGIETIGEFVVSRGEAAELFEAIEKSLDEVARLVAMPVDFARRIPVATGWTNGLSANSLDGVNQCIAVIALVGDHGFGWNGFNQGGALGDVSDLAGGQDQADGITQRIHAGMNFGGQSAPRAADFLLTCFFWAPDECWWARTIVESMNRCSRSASPCKAVASRSQTPFSRQREKRT